MSSGQLTNLKPAKVVAALKRLGWVIRKKTKGGNRILRKLGNPAVISIPFHKGKDVKPGLLSSELKGAGISIEEFRKAL